MSRKPTQATGWSAATLILAGASLAHGDIMNGVASDIAIQQFNQATGPEDSDEDGGGVFVAAANATTMRVGSINGTLGVAGGPTYYTGTAVVFVFQLPTLTAGTQFGTAGMTFTITGLGPSNNKGFTVDLYGLDARDANAVLAGDYFEGTADTTDATLLQQAIITASNTGLGANGSTSFPQTTTTSPTASVAFSNYLNAQYAGGAGAGRFIFLRLNTQEPSNTTSGGYTVASANNGDTTIRPFITFTTALIPEPASLSLLALGGMVALHGRRRA